MNRQKFRGVVVAPQPLAAETGRDILAQGGNAFDAAVAAAFVQMVTDPLMCGVGGMGVATVYPAQSQPQVISFYGRFGSRAREDMWQDRLRGGVVEGHRNQLGYESILVPGTVAGMEALHARWGSLPWAQLVQPAVRIAREGIPISSYIADFFHYPTPPQGPTQRERLGATPEMRRLWLKPDGAFLQPGEMMPNPDYARTLERIAEQGAKEFYRGAWGDAIARDLAEHGAHITRVDLASYRAQEEPPLVGNYRGCTIVTNRPPGGGVTLLQILAQMERHDLSALPHGGVEHLDRLATAMRLAFRERKRWIGDPTFVAMNVDDLLAPAHIAALHDDAAAAGPDSQPGTTHLTVVDAAGNCVAVTHTLGMGSGVITPGLGFQYNNAANQANPEPGHPNSPAPGKARTTGMAPTIVLKAGRPWLVLGSPGSNAIVNAVAQVIMNVIDFGLSPLEAVAAPRIHCEGGPVSAEARVPAAVVQALRQRGHEVLVSPSNYDTKQGRAQLVEVTEAGPCGASDPRRDGGVALYA